MADTAPGQPYQFGDVVDGHRWTITGWEPLVPSDRPMRVPRALEARYAASQKALARHQTQTLEREAPAPVDAIATTIASSPDTSSAPREEGSRTVMAAPDLAIEFDAHDGDPGPDATATAKAKVKPTPGPTVASGTGVPPAGWYPGSS